VLRYLGRYTHRVAISNHRLRAFDDKHVTFQWKDYAHENQSRTMTLSAMEFLRRFVQHILPRGFVRIRQSGFLANTCRTARVALARTLLAAARVPVTPASAATEAPTASTWACPRCGAAMILGPILSALHLTTITQGFDTSGTHSNRRHRYDATASRHFRLIRLVVGSVSYGCSIEACHEGPRCRLA